MQTLDILSSADMRAAIDLLERMNVPPHPDGFYRLHATADAIEQFDFDMRVEELPTYRLRLTASSLFDHEFRRRCAGRRELVTANEILERALLIDRAAAP